eukprot:1136908-Pelagomonas_calceolata.AAC.8
MIPGVSEQLHPGVSSKLTQLRCAVPNLQTHDTCVASSAGTRRLATATLRTAKFQHPQMRGCHLTCVGATTPGGHGRLACACLLAWVMLVEEMKGIQCCPCTREDSPAEAGMFASDWSLFGCVPGNHTRGHLTGKCYACTSNEWVAFVCVGRAVQGYSAPAVVRGGI